MIWFGLPIGNRQGGSCGITALAVITRQNWWTIQRLLKVKKPKNWRGSVNFHDVAYVLRVFKVRYRSRLVHRRTRVRDFRTEHGRLYMIDTLDHLALLKDGYILDQRGFFTLAQKGHWRLHRVYRIYA